VYLAIRKLNPNIFYVPSAQVRHNIPGKRLHFNYLRTLYLKTGNEEKLRVRVMQIPMGWWRKMIEFVLKFIISLGIWILYAMQGKETKGRYVMYSQWFTLKGFFMKEVFVR
jgi:hypothetical protein